MTESYEWSEVREKAVAGFGGDAPTAQLEQEVIEHFMRAPLRVIDEIARVASDLAAGRIRSGWPILRSRLGRSAELAVLGVVAEDTTEREKRIRNAERWIRNAGVHFDRAGEVEDELFGDVGRLRAYRDDDLLKQRLLDLWEQQRPRGELVEAEVEGRAAAWKASRGL